MEFISEAKETEETQICPNPARNAARNMTISEMPLQNIINPCTYDDDAIDIIQQTVYVRGGGKV
jgi:hypothetical protein